MTRIILLIFTITLFSTFNSILYAGIGDFDANETDTANDILVYYFDLRDRESYLQLTNTGIDVDPTELIDTSQNITVHIQIFDVTRDCIENDFFDVYTPNDTHIYNMRNIQTNDGNPSGIVLPEDAYGFVFAFVTDPDGTLNDQAQVLIGNSRILDANGYEYRTNAVGEENINNSDEDRELGYFNFNTMGDVTLSDIVGVVFDEDPNQTEIDVTPLDNFAVLNVDIYDQNEIPFSCRNVVYSCISPNSPLQEALLEKAAEEQDEDTNSNSSVARAEYGINNAIPHSKGGELLCPGNIITEGFTTLEVLNDNDETDDVIIWIGLNNGAGRGSMDSVYYDSEILDTPPMP